MAHEPKLEIYRIILKPLKSSEKDSSFYHLIGSLLYYKGIEFTGPKDAYQSFFNLFIQSLDKEFYKDKSKFKAITAYKKTETDILKNECISLHSSENIIEGIINGGPYGKKRIKSSIDNKESVEIINKENIIMDEFYFFLYLPEDHDVGLFMFQSYSDNTVKDVFIKFLRNLLKADNYKNTAFTAFFPPLIIEKFKEGCILNNVTYTENSIITDNFAEDDIKEEQDEFQIKIEIKSKKKVELGTINKVIEKLSSIEFNKKPLNNFIGKRIYLSNPETKRGAYYDLGNESEIKPTIYLKEIIDINEDGIPDFKTIKEFCYSQLKEILPEITP